MPQARPMATSAGFLTPICYKNNSILRIFLLGLRPKTLKTQKIQRQCKPKFSHSGKSTIAYCDGQT